MLTEKEFAQKIKEKYPTYSKVPDAILVQKIIAKYPVYQDQVQTSAIGRIAGAVSGVDPEVEKKAEAMALAQQEGELGQNLQEKLFDKITPDVTGNAMVDTLISPITAPAYGAYKTVTAPGNALMDSAEAAYEGGKDIVGGIYDQVTDKGPVTGEGFTRTVEGLLQVLSSPAVGSASQLPGGEKVLEAIGKVANAPAELGGFLYDFGLKQAGEDPTKPEYQLAKRQLMDAIMIGTPKIFEKGLPLVSKGGSALNKGISSALENSAKKNFEDVFSPKTNIDKKKTAAITEKIISGEEKLPFAATTESLLKKVSDKKDLYGEGIGAYKKGDPVLDPVTGKQMLDEAGKPVFQSEIKGSSKTETFTKWIDEQMERFQEKTTRMENGKPVLDEAGKPVVETITLDENAVSTLQGMKDTILKYGDEIPKTKLQGFKEKMDGILKKDGAYNKTLAEDTALSLKKDFVDVIRQEIASDNPSLAALNKKYSFYKTIEDLLKTRIQKQIGQKPISTKLMAILGAGLTTGGLLTKVALAGTTVGIYALMKTPGWKLVSSKWKTKLAEALAVGEEGGITGVVSDILNEYPALNLQLNNVSNEE